MGHYINRDFGIYAVTCHYWVMQHKDTGEFMAFKEFIDSHEVMSAGPLPLAKMKDLILCGPELVEYPDEVENFTDLKHKGWMYVAEPFYDGATLQAAIVAYAAIGRRARLDAAEFHTAGMDGPAS